MVPRAQRFLRVPFFLSPPNRGRILFGSATFFGLMIDRDRRILRLTDFTNDVLNHNCRWSEARVMQTA
jgi:hypothetical protein